MIFFPYNYKIIFISTCLKLQMLYVRYQIIKKESFIFCKCDALINMIASGWTLYTFMAWKLVYKSSFLKKVFQFYRETKISCKNLWNIRISEIFMHAECKWLNNCISSKLNLRAPKSHLITWLSGCLWFRLAWRTFKNFVLVWIKFWCDSNYTQNAVIMHAVIIYSRKVL